MNVYDFTVKDADNKLISLSDYKGKVLIITNTATGCGFTPQYGDFENLYKKYKSKGLEILSFPSNQFLGQAPGTTEEIKDFCSLKFGVTYKTFAKIDVNGKKEDPLYTFLKEQIPTDSTNASTSTFMDKLKSMGELLLGDNIKWNFTKFLIDKKGNVVKRFSPSFTPLEIEPYIKELL